MTSLQVHVRWLIQRDLEDVALICMASRGLLRQKTTDATQFRLLTENRKCSVISVVAEDRITDQVIGYLVYRLFSDHVHVLDFAVAREFRRRGVGKALLRKLDTARRPRLTAYVPMSRAKVCELLHSEGWTGEEYDDLGIWAFEKVVS